jgi:integrase
VRCLKLLVDEAGKAMTKAKLRSRFEAARDAAGVSGSAFQFRDLRRKAAADLRDQKDIFASQALLGHANVQMTEHYAAGKARKVSAIPRKASNGAGSK